MNITGSPISTTASAELPDLLERFWYWRGASGQNYIHSVYAPENCPPLPGAVYVGVRRTGGMRIAITVGRFGPFWGKSIGEENAFDFNGCDEVHVHLLSRSPDAAESVRRDLLKAMSGAADDTGLHESETTSRIAA